MAHPTRSGVGFLLWASERSLRKSKEVSDAARSKKDAHPTNEVRKFFRHWVLLSSGCR